MHASSQPFYSQCMGGRHQWLSAITVTNHLSFALHCRQHLQIQKGLCFLYDDVSQGEIYGSSPGMVLRVTEKE